MAPRNTIERSILVGLAALALSDMCYGLVSLPSAFLGYSSAVFTTRGACLYTRMYSSYVRNVFVNTSTWLNVITAIGRHTAICRPLRSSRLLSAKWVRVSAVVTLLAWSLIMLPKLTTYSVVRFECPGVVYYILDEGYLVHNRALHRGLSAVWAIIAYFVPVAILGFCYVQLVRALRQSVRTRRRWRCVVTTRNVNAGRQITSIILANLAMFVILVSPSEILNLYYQQVRPLMYKVTPKFKLAKHILPESQ